MSARFALGEYVARWRGFTRHDLSGSDSETLPLADLLALAEPEDRERWDHLDLSYAEPLGAPWLREAIARRYRAVDADGIVCCAGAQEAVACVARAILGPADHAVVVLPLYQPSEEAITGLCATTGVSLDDVDWTLDVDRVAAAIRPNTRLVLTNFPNSPTGAVLEPARLSALVALCRDRGLWLMNDEVYRQTDAAPADQYSAVVDVYERGVSINGLSKGFGLPGLRIGWAACREPRLRDGIVGAKSRLSSCVSSASEVLAHIALRAEAEIVARTRSIGSENRQALRDLLTRYPHALVDNHSHNVAFGFLRYVGPDGAEAFAQRLVRDVGVLLLPSTLWASPLSRIRTDHLRIGLGHVRSAYGLGRLERFLAFAT